MSGQYWLSASETWLAHFFDCRLKRKDCGGHEWLDANTGSKGITMYNPYMLLIEDDWEDTDEL